MRTWPTHLFASKFQRWQLRGVLKSGGPSMSGVAQRTRTDGGGYWAVELGEIPLRTADQIRAWRAWEAILDGGATKFTFEMCDPRQRPQVIINGVAVKPTSVPHGDNATFSDGADYASVPLNARLQASAALRATTVQLNLPNAELRGGEHFSMSGPRWGDRMYRVATIESKSGDVYTVTVRPPLREAYGEGAIVEFNAPRCVMQLAEPDGMAANVELHVRALETITFVEAF